MAVQYQSKCQNVTCTSITQDKDLDLYWMDHHGKTNGTNWSVSTYNSFDLKPYCEAKSKHDHSTCQKPLNIFVYSRFCFFALCGHLIFFLTMRSLLLIKFTFSNKLSELPESVSIDLLNNSSSVVEDTEFQLQCRITNVAPIRNLSVRWHRDNETLEPQSKGQVKLSLKSKTTNKIYVCVTAQTFTVVSLQVWVYVWSQYFSLP